MALLYQHYISEYNSKVERFLIKIAKKYGSDPASFLSELYGRCGITKAPKKVAAPKKKIRDRRPPTGEVIRLKKNMHNLYVHEESLLVIDKCTHLVKGRLESFDSSELLPIDREVIHEAKFHRLPLGKLPENLR